MTGKGNRLLSGHVSADEMPMVQASSSKWLIRGYMRIPMVGPPGCDADDTEYSSRYDRDRHREAGKVKTVAVVLTGTVAWSAASQGQRRLASTAWPSSKRRPLLMVKISSVLLKTEVHFVGENASIICCPSVSSCDMKYTYQWSFARSRLGNNLFGTSHFSDSDAFGVEGSFIFGTV